MYDFIYFCMKKTWHHVSVQWQLGDMLWTYFMSLPGVMYTGLYLISRSRIVAYLDDIVKFGDDIYPNLQLTSNMSFLLQSRGRQPK